jgi:hypothetical protein
MGRGPVAYTHQKYYPLNHSTQNSVNRSLNANYFLLFQELGTNQNMPNSKRKAIEFHQIFRNLDGAIDVILA